MKKILLSILLIGFNTFPQEETSPSVEIFFGTVTEPGYNEPITFNLSTKDKFGE